MSDQEREAILSEIRKKKVVLTLPGMDMVTVRTTTYKTMDIYYPPPTPGLAPPVVVNVMGYPDPEGGVRSFGPFTSWARLIAASGMACVLFGTASPVEETDAAVDYLRSHAGELQLDAGRLGVISSSGNVPTALSLLMRDRTIACAALLCGYTMDLDGASFVAGHAKQYGFVDACAGKSVDDLPDAIPMLFVRAGREQFAGVNDALDTVVARSLARNLPITLVNNAAGVHGFDIYEDSERSREIVRLVLAFLAVHLKYNLLP